MTITISQQDYWDLIRETKETESSFFNQARIDETIETIWKYPPRLGKGLVRDVQLREGLILTIADYQIYEDIITFSFDREHPLEYKFDLAEVSQSLADTIPYNLCGSGLALKEKCQEYANQPILSVSVHIEPEVFQSFAGQSGQHLPSVFGHLVGNPNHQYYLRPGRATPAMKVALEQILQCLYQGMTRRMFLDSKVMEIMALILEDEMEAQETKPLIFPLKSDDVERLYYAREILHNNFDNPPSIAQLARQVGLNECTLKQGFRACFNTTVFGYLRRYRMEQAKILLMQGRMNVYEAAQTVGYASQSSFARVFRKTFGISPKAFSIQYRE
ncbi:MAG: AraC family transcriptional regulator [Geminocystis sp.]